MKVFDVVSFNLYKNMISYMFNVNERGFLGDNYVNYVEKLKLLKKLIGRIYRDEYILESYMIPEDLFKEVINKIIESESYDGTGMDILLAEVNNVFKEDLTNYEKMLKFFLRLVLYLSMRFSRPPENFPEDWNLPPISIYHLLKSSYFIYLYYKPNAEYNADENFKMRMGTSTGIIDGNFYITYTKASNEEEEVVFVFKKGQQDPYLIPNVITGLNDYSYSLSFEAGRSLIERFINFKQNLPALICYLDNFLDYVESKNAYPDGSDEVDSTQNHFNPTSKLASYEHRAIKMPIRGDSFGIEIEYSGDVQKVSNFGKEFKYLLNNGWILEHDGSVTFEMKSPIMSLDTIKSDVAMCKNLFDAWSKYTNSNSAGLHIHIGMDDMFSTDKRPASKTYIFLTKFIQETESKLFGTAESRKKVFKRDFTNYAKSCLNLSNIVNERYLWINLQNLNSSMGKTIEFRLGSSALANEFDVYAEKVYILAKLIKSALSDWRRKGRPEFAEWKSSFGDQKLLKALLPKDLTKRFVELFK